MFKKLLSGVLCLSMLCSLCLPVAAAEITTPSSGETTVTYGMDESFLVVIPGDFNIRRDVESVYILAQNVMLGANKILEVSISGDDYINGWELIDISETSNRISYAIGTTVGSNNIMNGSVVLSVNAGEAYNSIVSENLFFTILDNLTRSGIYRDTLTFTVNILSNVLEGSGQTYHSLAPSSLTFRSLEPIGEFERVEIDGEILDDSSYILTEGSTIVTLPVSYLETLEAGNYEINIVSKNRAVKGRFGVVIPVENKDGFYYNQPYVANLPAFGGETAFFVRTDGTYDIITVGKIPNTGTYTIEGNKISATHPLLGEINCIISGDGMEIYCEEIQATFKLGSETFAADDEYIYVYNDATNGYGVTVIDNEKYSYDNIRSEINGIPIVEINKSGFAGNRNLDVFPNLPDNIRYIDAYAFESCIGLKQINIPKSVISIGDCAFALCNNLETIYYEGTIEEWENIVLGNDWANMTSLSQIICSDGIIQ